MAGSYPMTSDRGGRRRRRGRLLVALLISLMVLVGALVAADRVAVNFAEDRIAQNVRTRVAQHGLHSAPPEVAIGGFPFVTQVIDGRYRSIRVSLRDVRGEVAGTTARVPQLDVELRDVIASLDALRGGGVTARAVRGRATISYDTVEEFIDRPGLELHEQDGRLHVVVPLPAFGREFTLRGVAQLVVESQQVRLRVTELTAPDLPPLPELRALVDAYAEQISVRIPLPDLPFGLEVREAWATPDGIAVSADATDVRIDALA